MESANEEHAPLPFLSEHRASYSLTLMRFRALVLRQHIIPSLTHGGGGHVHLCSGEGTSCSQTLGLRSQDAVVLGTAECQASQRMTQTSGQTTRQPWA